MLKMFKKERKFCVE